MGRNRTGKISDIMDNWNAGEQNEQKMWQSRSEHLMSSPDQLWMHWLWQSL